MKTRRGKEGQEVSERLLKAEQGAGAGGKADASHSSNLMALPGIGNTQVLHHGGAHKG